MAIASIRRVRPAVRCFLWYWLPVVIWMASIFGFSTDAFSVPHTSRFTRPFLLWLKPDITEEWIEFAQGCVRKSFHGIEYAILVVLLWRALYRPGWRERRAWSRENAVAAWCLAFAYAISDEFHQSFVSSREGHPRDVCFDAAGAFLGLFVIWVAGRFFRRW